MGTGIELITIFLGIVTTILGVLATFLQGKTMTEKQEETLEQYYKDKQDTMESGKEWGEYV